MQAPIVMRPIGHVEGSRKQPTDDDWAKERAEIVLDGEQFGPAALAGLADFSHVQVLFVMHGVAEGDVETEARHPRNRADWPKVGIFAQRAKRRPNRIGLACCRIVSVAADELRVRVEDLDAIDGTPVLDLKPWVQEFGPRGEVRQPTWMTELMKGYF